ncbi:MAG TPA: N-acetyltransferase [Nitrospira sp.]|jgi:ribosomal protein S18 acetylase RimI-like enzyme
MDRAQQLTIRPAGSGDVDTLVAFSAAMAWETEQRKLDEERLRQGTQSLLRTPSLGFFMVAEAGEAEQAMLVGQLMITYEWSDWRNGVFWWIQSLYVAPAWRRRGVFRRMLEEIMTSARAAPDVCGVRLYVEQENRTAQAVYQRLGLSPSGYKVYEQDFVLRSHARGHAPNSS